MNGNPLNRAEESSVIDFFEHLSSLNAINADSPILFRPLEFAQYVVIRAVDSNMSTQIIVIGDVDYQSGEVVPCDILSRVEYYDSLGGRLIGSVSCDLEVESIPHEIADLFFAATEGDSIEGVPYRNKLNRIFWKTVVNNARQGDVRFSNVGHLEVDDVQLIFPKEEDLLQVPSTRFLEAVVDPNSPDVCTVRFLIAGVQHCVSLRYQRDLQAPEGLDQIEALFQEVLKEYVSTFEN